MGTEADITNETKWFYELRAREVIKGLEKRNIEAQYAASRTEALDIVLGMIPLGAVVARGDSVTLFQIGVMRELARRGQNRLIDPFPEGGFPPREERRRIQREALLADVFLTSANAITRDGRIVNVDGAGNRVAALVFGPKKVIVVAGVNKLVRDLDAALERVHDLCTPLGAWRHHLKHEGEEFLELPCVRTGRCADCLHPWRPCRYTVIVEGVMPPEKGRIGVVLVGEHLGV